MLKQPLFGEDSSPHITSMLVSAIATLVCWIIFCILCFVVKFKPQVPEYKEVQIVLSSTPIEEKQEESSSATAAAAASAEAAIQEPVQEEAAPVPEIPNPVETPVAQAKEEASKSNPAPAKPQTQPKTQTTTRSQTQPAKTSTTPAPKTTDPSKKVNFDDYQYATDYSDFDFNNTSTSSSKSSFDWSQFDDSDPEPQVSQKVDKVTSSSSISGSAASTSTQKNQTQTSASSSSSTNTTPAASSSTSNAAANIKNATGSTSNNSNSASTNNTQQFSSDLDMTWNGGVARKQSGRLSINLDSVSSYINEKKTTVGIEFTVDEKGYVIAGTIKIDRESLLNKNVRDAIISQISKWRFTEASTRSTASFEYTIIKQ